MADKVSAKRSTAGVPARNGYPARRKRPRYSADRPNRPPTPDLLGRDEFAARLASDIKTWRGNDSLVISLYGNWGCGKTSLKDRVIWHLRRKIKDYPILEFNPWQFSGSGSLALPFLRELDAILKSGTAGAQSEKASKSLAHYARHLSLAGVAAKVIAQLFATQQPEVAAAISMAGEGAKQIGDVSKQASEALDEEVKDENLADIKKSLSDVMATLDRPILVVIDDIDRLSEVEILEIFQLVKVNADFPRLIYLLLFDRPVVCEALNKVSNNRGSQYLEKIVQVPYHIPEAPREKVRELLFKGIDECMDGCGAMDRWEQERWSSLFLDGMAAYFKNLRHVYRFLGSFDFQVRHFQRKGGFEVNPVDLLGLETLRVFEPELYERLFSEKPLLTGDYGVRFFPEKERDEITTAATALVSTVSEPTRLFASHIIQQIFPPTSGNTDNPTDEWLRQARVCHSDIFDKYFTLQIAASDLGQVEVEQLTKLADHREKFVIALREIGQRGLLEKAMSRFEAYKDQLPLSAMPALITALCDCADVFPERAPGYFGFDALIHAWRIVYFGLKRELESRRFDILKHAFEATKGVVFPVAITSREERGKDHDETHEYLTDEAQVDDLKIICTLKLRASADSGALRKTSHSAMLLWRWSEWGSVDEVRRWVTDECDNNSGTAWLLSVLTSTGTSNGKPFHYLTFSTLARFIDPAVVKAHVEKLESSSLEEREKIGLEQFRRAWKRKQDGKPDLTGREWGSEKG